MITELIIKTALFTILIELMVLIILKAPKKVLFISIIMNLITNISMNLSINLIPHQFFNDFYLIVFEVLVVIIEFFIYFKITKNKNISLNYSLLCNISSLVLGLLVLKYLV